MIDAIGSALNGLAGASRQVAESAGRVANPGNGETLTRDLIDIRVAETVYKANLATLRTAQEMSDELLHAFDEKV